MNNLAVTEKFVTVVEGTALSDTQIAQCRSLTLAGGFMRGILNRGITKDLGLTALLIEEGPEVVAWALLDASKPKRTYLHVFVREDRRRMGLASALVNAAEDITKDFTVSPHDQGSLDFFCGFDMDRITTTQLHDEMRWQFEDRWQQAKNDYYAGL